MKDNQLFQFIKHVVKQKQNQTKDTSKSLTFAQKYCKEQLIKKKLNSYNPHDKITHLMKNFKDLQNFVDLPELILQIKKWKFKQQNNQTNHQVPKQSFLIRQSKNDQNLLLHKKIKKQLGDKIKQKYLNECTQAKEILKYLQENTNIRSQGLKNNSYTNLNILFEEVQQQGDDQTWKGNFDFLEYLHKRNRIQNINLFEQNDKQQNTTVNGIETISDAKIGNDKQCKSKMRRQYTKLLHKITTYLQIILQTEHKQKWDKKKYTHKSLHNVSANTNTVNNNILTNSSIPNTCSIKMVSSDSLEKIKTSEQIYKQVQMKSQFKRNKFQRLEKQNNNSNDGVKTLRTKRLRKLPLLLHQRNNSEANQMSNFYNRKNNQGFQKQLVNGSLRKYQYSHLNRIIQNESDSSTIFTRQKMFRTIHNDSNKETQTQNSTKKQLLKKSSTIRQQEQQNLSSSQNGKRNDSFYRTTTSFKFRTQAILDQYPIQRKKSKYSSWVKLNQQSSQQNQQLKNKQIVKQNFTFRNRNVKQKLVNKLQNFIREIDQQQHNNKKQNNYYNSAINRLENTLSMSFAQFRQQAVAGDVDVEILKKYAAYYNNSTTNGPAINLGNFNQLIHNNDSGPFNYNGMFVSQDMINQQLRITNDSTMISHPTNETSPTSTNK